jgi:hypothetical protein
VAFHGPEYGLRRRRLPDLCHQAENRGGLGVGALLQRRAGFRSTGDFVGGVAGSVFAQFLNFSKRSCFENANMLILFEKRGLISSELRDRQLAELETESRMIESFRKSLMRGSAQ